MADGKDGKDAKEPAAHEHKADGGANAAAAAALRYHFPGDDGYDDGEDAALFADDIIDFKADADHFKAAARKSCLNDVGFMREVTGGTLPDGTELCELHEYAVTLAKFPPSAVSPTVGPG